MALPAQIAAGSVLFRAGTVLPANVHMSQWRDSDWELVRGEDAFFVDRKVRAMGWHVHFIVPPVKVSAIGIDAQATFAKALRRLTRAVEGMGCNGIQVTAVNQRRCLGLQYVSITANPRHAQKGPYMRELNPHHSPQLLWDFKFFTVRNRRVSPIRTMQAQ